MGRNLKTFPFLTKQRTSSLVMCPTPRLPRGNPQAGLSLSQIVPVLSPLSEQCPHYAVSSKAGRELVGHALTGAPAYPG